MNEPHNGSKKEPQMKQANDASNTGGIFKRIFTKIDDAMKAKADAQAENGCCPDSKKDGKGNKCC